MLRPGMKIMLFFQFLFDFAGSISGECWFIIYLMAISVSNISFPSSPFENVIRHIKSFYIIDE